MPSLNDYRGMLDSYTQANPYLAEGDMGGEMGEGGFWNPTNDAQTGAQNQGVGFLNSLSPDQRAEYQQLMSQDFAKKSGNMKLAFGAAAAGMGGLAALYGGGAGLGAGAGAEAGLAGAGAESFPVYGGGEAAMSANFADPMAMYAPEVGAGGAMPSSQALWGSPAASGMGGGPEFGSPEQRASDYAGGYGNTNNVTPASVNSGGNPILDQLKQVLGYGGANTPLGQVSQAGKIGSNLLDLYNTYDSRKRNKGFINNLNSLYTQDSPYAQQLNKSLQRAYAASGRRSDVGGRNVELQAKLAEMNSRLAPTLNTANNQQGMYQNRMLGSMWDLGNRTGFFDKAANGLMGLFGG